MPRARSPAVPILAFAAIVIPVAAWLCLPLVPARGALVGPHTGGSRFAAPRLAFAPRALGPAIDRPPRITNVRIVDVDDDGVQDLLACDALDDRVVWYRQAPIGTFEERILADELPDSCHTALVDFDRDGDTDVLVAVLGDVFPNDTHVGSVVLLEQQPGFAFQKRTLVRGLRRVADVQAADFDGDGDMDLAVAVFGFTHGEVLWLENRGDAGFANHQLHFGAGAIHVPIGDFDGDGDLDVATVISQDEETVLAFENRGGGAFRRHVLASSPNFDLGSAGLVSVDLDRDGDLDLLWPVGDNFENDYTFPQPYHGCFWLENRGGFRFAKHRIATFGGTYAADAGDIDGDGDVDVVLVSMFNEWRTPGNASVVWLENDGRQGFTPWQVADRPTHLVTVACGDLDGDGRADIAAGGLHVIAPYDRMGRVTVWTGR
jgi:hypothetical protein